MRLKLRFTSFNYYFCVVYNSPNNVDSPFFDLLASSIEYLLTTDYRSHVTIERDFKVCNREWLVNTSDTSVRGFEAEQFAVANNLSRLIELPHTHPIEHWRPCSCALSYPHFSHLSLLTYFYSSVSRLSGHCDIASSVIFTHRIPLPSSRENFGTTVQPTWTVSADS